MATIMDFASTGKGVDILCTRDGKVIAEANNVFYKWAKEKTQDLITGTVSFDKILDDLYKPFDITIVKTKDIISITEIDLLVERSEQEKLDINTEIKFIARDIK